MSFPTTARTTATMTRLCITATCAAMLFLVPVTLATPAVQDFSDLRTVIQAAASTIGADSNPNKGWGFGLLGAGGSEASGTAFLVNNITSMMLRSKWQLDTNKTLWLTPNDSIISPNSSKMAWSPTAPITSSIILPSALPSAASGSNLVTDLSGPYMDYIYAIPNLSSGLLSLGRSYHVEMNAPVSQAIDALQQSMSALQSSMLQSDLINGSAVVRTVRGSSSLEDAQQAWSRLLNLPGRV